MIPLYALTLSASTEMVWLVAMERCMTVHQMLAKSQKAWDCVCVTISAAATHLSFREA